MTPAVLNTIVQGAVALGAIVVVALGAASAELGLLVALSAIGCSVTSAKLGAAVKNGNGTSG